MVLRYLNRNNAENRTPNPTGAGSSRYQLGLRGAQCVAWCPRTGGLWVGTTDGVVLCDRFLGRHRIHTGDAPASMAWSRDGEVGVVIGQGGRLSMLRRDSSLARRHVATGLHARLHVFRSQGRFYASGVGPSGGRLFRVRDAGVRLLGKLPEGAACGPGPRGPQVATLYEGRPVLTPPRKVSWKASDAGHALMVRRPHIVSWTAGAVCIRRGGGDPVTVLVDGVSSCDLDRRGRRLAVGTLDGRFGWIHLDRAKERQRPRLRRLSRAPVRAVRFSADGGHLATASDDVEVWDVGGGPWSD